jgi:hypothetical protein
VPHLEPKLIERLPSEFRDARDHPALGKENLMDKVPPRSQFYSKLLVVGGMIAVWGSLIFVIAAAIADGL